MNQLVSRSPRANCVPSFRYQSTSAEGVSLVNDRTLSFTAAVDSVRGLQYAVEMANPIKTDLERQVRLWIRKNAKESSRLEFKLKLYIGTPGAKAEFIRDVIALANSEGETPREDGHTISRQCFRTQIKLRIPQHEVCQVCATSLTPESFGKLRYGRRCTPPFPKLRFQLDGDGLGIEHGCCFLSLVCEVQSS
jgi:hypothetical protein